MIDADKILLINCSRPNYNLAIEKMKVFFGDRCKEVSSVSPLMDHEFDGLMLSVIFSWDVPFAIDQAKVALNLGKKVMIGGGGTYQLRNWIKKETCLDAHYQAQDILESMPGKFKMVYFTRGCVRKCFFCIVPKIEGDNISINPVSIPAPMLLDNNLSELPRSFQEQIVDKYLSSGLRIVDANSGFEPNGITPECVTLFNQLPLKYWRVGFDEIKEEKEFIESVRIIKAYSKKPIRVYTMFGQEPIEQCRYRCEKVIELGCEPVPQAYIQLNAKEKKPIVMHDWSQQKLSDFQRFFYSPQLWRKIKLHEYAPRVNQKPNFTL